MSGTRIPETFRLSRRDFGVLALGAASSLWATCSRAENSFDWLDQEVTADINSVREDVREEAAYLLGMISFVYGYPMVVMDVTREVLTAAPTLLRGHGRTHQSTRQDAALRVSLLHERRAHQS